MSRSTSNPRAATGSRVPAVKRPCPVSSDLFYPSQRGLLARKDYHASIYGSLIPSDCTSALEGIKSFRTEFERRYCAFEGLVPPFFIGSLQEAISEAFDKPIIFDRRPLVLYIHQDGYSVMRSFQEALCFNETVAMLRSHFVLWPWDVTTMENRVKLMTWLTESSLYNVISEVVPALANSIDDDHFSKSFFLMLMLTKNGGTLKIEEKIDSYPHPGKLFDTLTKVMKQYADVKIDEIRENVDPRIEW